ncbi:MAG TPA: hypothetical protein VN420_01920 [Candidatus Fimivivens sp.]|nr:hypothetical protein [Candidatus Fimivivens sp.]
MRYERDLISDIKIRFGLSDSAERFVEGRLGSEEDPYERETGTEKMLSYGLFLAVSFGLSALVSKPDVGYRLLAHIGFIAKSVGRLEEGAVLLVWVFFIAVLSVLSVQSVTRARRDKPSWAAITSAFGYFECSWAEWTSVSVGFVVLFLALIPGGHVITLIVLACTIGAYLVSERYAAYRVRDVLRRM